MQKKIRGKGRLWKNFLKFPKLFDSFFPDSDGCRDYWKYMIPIHEKIFEKSFKIRFQKELIRTMLNALMNLQKNKPKNTKVVLSISFPNFFQSQLIVFFSEEYYKNFFTRDTSFQKWEKISEEKCFLRESGIGNSSCVSKIGFRENIVDEDFSYEGEIWFFGDVPTCSSKPVF